MTSPTLIDLSHTVEDGMITYRGLPAPTISDHWRHEDAHDHYAEGTTFHIGKIEMVANTGTYVDAPFHRFADGDDVSQIDLASLANLPGVVVRAPQGVRSLGRDAFTALDVAGKAVLVHTGWDRHWRTDKYFRGHPFLTAGAAHHLREAGADLVGIDSLNIDDTEDGRRPVHTALLRAGVPVVEHLCRLDRLPDGDFRFFAVPVKVRGMGSFPVRAFALAP